MELKVNLTSRTEVAAAAAIFAAILGGAVPLLSEVADDAADVPVQPTGFMPQAPQQIPPPAVAGAPTPEQIFASTQPIPQPEQTVAQVFAPQQQAADAPLLHPGQLGHIPVPGTAGVAPSQIAQGVPQGFGTPGMPLAPTGPVPQPGLPAGAPSAPAGPTAPAWPADFDKENTPWDASIHTSNRAKTQAGVWKAKPGLDKTVAANTRAQLQAQWAHLVGGGQPQMTASVQQQPQQGLPTPQPQAQQPLPNPTTFKDLINRVTPLINAGRLPNQAVNDACLRTGQLSSIVGLQQNEAWVPTVWSLLVTNNPQAFV